jgi:hypothetical protein
MAGYKVKTATSYMVPVKTDPVGTDPVNGFKMVPFIVSEGSLSI